MNIDDYTDIDSIRSKIASLQNEYQKIKDTTEKIPNELNALDQKTEKFVNFWYIGLGIGEIVLLFIGLYIAQASRVASTIVFLIWITLLIGGLLYGKWVRIQYKRTIKNGKQTIENNNAKLQTISNDISSLDTKAKTLVSTELCSLFGITQYQLEYDLTGILNIHAELRNDWWLIQGKTDVIIDALSRKYQRDNNEIVKSDLQVEHLKLQNESIAIDNTQKKFWTCQFCGNMNRADDMSCIKCGGIRPSAE